MRGLTLFITDLRKCVGKEEELKRINKELANIRGKFKGEKPLDGYQKKKYVCKLLFMYLLGYKCDFGQMEAVNLLLSNAYTEKQIGYLYISVVMGEKYNFLPLVLNALKDDLLSDKPVFQNLALQFIANNPSRKIADFVAESVVEVLLSSATVEFVKQTAALTLLQLLRLKPDLIIDEFKANRIVNLISYHNLGVVTASASLVEFLAKKFTTQYESCMPHCIVRLCRIITTAYIDFQDYTYYSIGAPWITVKLLRILQNFSTPTDLCLKGRLRECLDMILNKVQEPPRSRKFEHNNSKYAILFEAISLIIQMEIDDQLLTRAISILGTTLHQKEVNLRFMALDMMTQLSSNEMCLGKVKSEWSAVLNALKSESDITIKKRAVDLLYLICDARSVKPIVDEMLHFLECGHDFSEDVVLKTAALAEQFSADREWYIDTIMSMFQICGDKVNDSVWHSLVKVVVDDDSIQEYAARASFAALCESACHDTVIKVAAYILGEFGYLIARDPRSNYGKQLSKLREKYACSSLSTKALLLTTFMKFLNIYPDMKNEIQSILKDKRNVQNENEEIQQRAVEYLKLSEIASKSLLAAVLEEMPSSSKKESAVVTAIEKKKSQQFVAAHQVKCRKQKNLTQYRSQCNLTAVPETPKVERIHMSRSASHSNLRTADHSSNFKLLMDIFKEAPTVDTISETFSTTCITPSRLSAAPNNDLFLHNLLFNENGMLYEDQVIRVLVECEFRKHFGRFHLKYINKTPNDLSEFSVKGNFAYVENKCSVWFKPSKSLLPSNETMEQDIHLECLCDFIVRPSITLKFTFKGQQREVKLILPLTVNKFVEPGHMDMAAFNIRWQNYNSVGQNVIKEFSAKYPMIYAVTRQKLRGFRVSVIENGTSDSDNFYCAGVFYTRTSRTGFLVRLIRHDKANKYCSTVRSYQPSLSNTISNLLFELL